MDFNQLQKAVLTLNRIALEQQTEPSDFCATSRTGMNILQYCITVIDKMKMNFEDILNVCLSHGVNINHRNTEGLTALHFAVAHKQIKAVDALIRNGADVDAVDRDGFTPLFLAVSTYRGEANLLGIISALISGGADLNRCNTSGVSPIEYARNLGAGIDKGYNPKEWDLRSHLSLT